MRPRTVAGGRGFEGPAQPDKLFAEADELVGSYLRATGSNDYFE